MNFDAKAYWATRKYKKFVVSLTSTIGRGKQAIRKHQVMYCGGENSAQAIKVARENTFLSGRISGSCRLATPEDLGCVATVRPGEQGGRHDSIH